MKWTIMMLALLLFAGAMVLAAPGPCGDVNDDDTPYADIVDLNALIGYLLHGGVLAEPADADVDGKKGITFCDLIALTDHLFTTYEDLDCSASDMYDYTLIMEDTIIMPMARCIPNAVDSVILDIEFRLHSDNPWVFLPFDPMAQGSNDKFAFSHVSGGPAGIDSASGIWVHAADYSSTGGGTLQLHYGRVNAGYGVIHTGPLDIDTFKRFSIVTGYSSVQTEWDLRRPVIVYCWPYDYPSGDMNCDCAVTITDLTIMNDGLFISLTWPSPCPCGF